MSYTISATRDALLTLASSTLGLPDGAVGRGQFGTYIADEQFLLGSATGEPGSRGDWEPANVGLPSLWSESYDVAAQIRVYAGDDDIPAREDRAETLMQSFADGLHADQSLGGVVLRAYLASWSLTSGVTSKGGTAAEMDLTVRVVNITS